MSELWYKITEIKDEPEFFQPHQFQDAIERLEELRKVGRKAILEIVEVRGEEEKKPPTWKQDESL